MDEIEKNHSRLSLLFFWYLGLIIVTVVCVHGLVYLYHAFPHQPIPNVFPTAKPCENFVVSTLCIFIPVIASLSITFVARRSYSVSLRYAKPILLGLVLLMTLISLFALLGSDFLTLLAKGRHLTQGRLNGFFIGSGLLFVWIWFYDLSSTRYQTPSRFYRTLKWKGCLFFLILFMLLTFGFRLYDIQIIQSSWQWLYSIEPELYVLSQTLAGKTLLVDLPSMYGYFPIFLTPILHLFGAHSLFAVTILFAILLFIAFAALYFVLYKQLYHTSLFLLCGLAILLLNTEAYTFPFGGQDPYYQYDPIRCFWPFISVLVFYFYLKRPSFTKSILFSVLAGIAIVWNIDTGVPIAGAFLAFLSLQILFALTDQRRVWQTRKHEIGRLLLKILLHLIIIAACFGGFLYLTFLKSGGPIQYEWLDKYQQIFYVMGYGMLPLPLDLHPWMLVVAVYLFGIMASQFYAYKNGAPTRFTDLILYLSILGVGLFMYYSGRAHILNLMKVMWPAVVISTLLVDRLFHFIKRGLISQYLGLLAIPYGIVMICCAVNILSSIPGLAKDSAHFLTHFRTMQDPLIESELNFIQKNKGNNSECLILTLHQSIYYLETGLASPVKWPGVVQGSYLESDRDQLLAQILSHPVNCIFYGVGPATAASALNLNLNELLGHYQIKAQNSEGTMLLLVASS